MRAQQGFTLIELLIVVVIIGVLAMFAIPQFQNRTASAQVSRVVMETSQLRTAVEMCMMQGIDDDEKCDGLKINSDIIKNNTPEVSLKDNITISAEFEGNASNAIKNKNVTWTYTQANGWTCTSTVDEKYQTKGCAAAPANGG